MTFIPVSAFVLIETCAANEVSSGGIHIPASAQTGNTGKIISAGTDAPTEVHDNIGATLVFLDGASKRFQGMPDNQALVKTENILGISLPDEAE